MNKRFRWLVPLLVAGSILGGCVQAYSQGFCVQIGKGVNSYCNWGSGCYADFPLFCAVETCRIGVGGCQFNNTPTMECSPLGCYNPWWSNCSC